MPTPQRLTPRVRQVLRWLRRHYPLRVKVTVRSVHQPDLHGSVLYDERSALIRLSPDKDAIMVESLVEEWSHLARAECPIPIIDDHDALFWAIYGAISLKMRGET